MATASLGGVVFPLDPEAVAWHSNTKTQATDTVGGKVVQVYGTSISEITMRGSFGRGGFAGAQSFLGQVSNWVNSQVGSLTPHNGQGIWNGTPLQFLFPFRGWDFLVYISRYYSPEAAQSIVLDNRTVNYQWALSLFVVADNGTLAKETDATLLSYMNRISQSFGWEPNLANGNINAPGSTVIYPTETNIG